jgi:hypothetical protein
MAGLTPFTERATKRYVEDGSPQLQKFNSVWTYGSSITVWGRDGCSDYKMPGHSRESMLEAIERYHWSRKNARLLHEIAFSIYFPMLIIMTNSIRSVQHPAKNSWSDDLELLIARSGYAPGHNIASIFLWVISAAFLFFCLRALASLLIVDFFLRTFGGIFAVADFPLVAAYVSFFGYLHMLGSFKSALLYAYAPHRWLGVEVVASHVCVFSCVFLQCPPKGWWGLLLLVLHFSIWTWFVFTGGNQSLLIFLLLGFLASLAWGFYLWQSAAKTTLKPADGPSFETV